MRLLDFAFALFFVCALIFIVCLYKFLFVQYRISILQYMIETRYANGLITCDEYYETLPLIEKYSQTHSHVDYLKTKNEIDRISSSHTRNASGGYSFI